jgi:hypothetical protein
VRRRKPRGVQPLALDRFGVSHALVRGGLAGAFDHEPTYTLDVLRATWEAHRAEVIAASDGRPIWAALVFDDGLTVEEADAALDAEEDR